MSVRLKRALYLGTAAILLYVTALAVGPLQSMRERYDLTSQPGKGLTPQLALATQLFGWGRGLIIDVLWIRMESLKQQEKFFELVQLADWACKLAPRIPQVWDIQSWNLAYNVSCKVSHLPDRWVWVQAGLDMLRDEGIPNNPNSAMLYDRLAWTYFHKIGEQDDNAHFFYKQTFGLLMHEVLGGEGDQQTLIALKDAPRSPKELLEDQDVKRLWTECGRHGFDIIADFFEWYKGTLSVPAGATQLLKHAENATALHKVEMCARANRLREELKLDPARMLALAQQYGPFDWRSAYPHAIYWASLGLEKLDELEKRTVSAYAERGMEVPLPYNPKKETWREGEKLYEFRRVMLKRIIYASMQSLVAHGRLLFDTRGRLLLEAGMDYRFADATLPLYEDILEAHGMRFKVGTQDGYMNFLKRGIMHFYLLGDTGRAADYFRRLREKFPAEVKKPSFEEYIQDALLWWRRDMTTGEARIDVQALLVRSFFAMGCNADDVAAMLEATAKAYAERWNRDAEPNLRGTINYDNLREAALVDILTGRLPFPPDVLANLKERLGQVKDDLIQRVLDNLEKGRLKMPEPEEVEQEWEMQTYGKRK